MRRSSSLFPRHWSLAPSAFVLCLWLAAVTPVTARPARDVFVSRAAAETVAVRFVVTAPTDTPADADVYLAGSLPAVGNWKANGLKLERQEDGTYLADVTLEVGATLEYKFNRGDWASVEKNDDGTEVANRRYTIGANPTRIDTTIARWADVEPTTEPASTVVGTLELHDIDSTALGGARTIRVWLPPGYDDHAAINYDVLYMQDGQNCFDAATSAFGHEWEVDETLTTLIEAKTIRPIIVVGIDNGGEKRIDEMTFDADAKHGGGHADTYATFLLDEVRPFVEKTYHVAVGKDHTFIGGSSLGGLVSLDLARRHPNTFAGVIAMSPSLWWNDGSLPKAIAKDVGGLKGARVWLDSGSNEESDSFGFGWDKNATAVQALNDRLTSHKVASRVTIANRARHNEEAWAKRFPDAIQYIVGSVTP